MRLGWPRLTVRRMMVAVAAIALAIAYVARYYKCNSIADQHLRASLPKNGESRIFARSRRDRDEEDYHEINYYKYQEAALYPWVRVPLRFIPYEDAERSVSVK